MISAAALVTGGVTLVVLLGAYLATRRAKSPPPSADPQPGPVDAQTLLETLRASGGNEGLRVKGDIIVKTDLALPQGFILEGSLTLAEGTTLDAPIEVFGSVTLGDRARLTAPILVHGDATLGRHARASPAHVDGDVVLHAGAAIEGSLRCGTLYIFEDEHVVPATPAAEEAIMTEPFSRA